MSYTDKREICANLRESASHSMPLDRAERGRMLRRLHRHMEEKLVEGLRGKVYNLRLRAEGYLVAVSQFASFVRVYLVSIQERSIGRAEIKKMAHSWVQRNK